MIVSLIPAQSAGADWTGLAKCAAITGSITATAFMLGWAQDIANNQHKIETHRTQNILRHPQAPGGANANIAAPERDSRPARYASEYGIQGLLVGSFLALLYGVVNVVPK